MAVEGSLDLFRLPEILQVISQEGKTGILTVRGEKDIVAISFAKGRVVAADALNRTLEAGLGETLAKEGLLDRARYDAALVEQQRSGGRLIDVLVDGGYLERAQLLTGLRRHTSDLLAELLAWDDGEFKFYANDEVSFEDGFDPIVVETFLLHHLDAVSTTGSAPVATPAEFPMPEEPELPAAAPSTPDLALGADEVGGGLGSLWDPDPVGPDPSVAVAPSGSDEFFPSLDDDPFESVSAPRSEPSPAVPAPTPREPVSRPARQTPAAEPTSAPAPRRPAPAPVPTSFEEDPEEIPRDPRPVRDVAPTAARWLAAVAAVLLLVAFWWAPLEALLPLPWDAPVRRQAGSYYEAARVPVVDSALRGHFLTEGELPESLEPLAESGQVAPGTLVSPLAEGRRVAAFRRDGLEYSLAFREEPSGIHQGSLVGDFLLDPDTLGTIRREGPPLILLD